MFNALFPAYVAEPSLRRRNIFAYIDARDVGYMVDCCLRTDCVGYFAPQHSWRNIVSSER